MINLQEERKIQLYSNTSSTNNNNKQHKNNRKKVSPEVGAHQHSSASEPHHAHSAFEHEALEVCGGHLQFEGFGAVHPVGLLGLSVRIVHALHVLSQFIFPL